ncbi:MAG: TetR/AcrR family transcriptional regulator [Flavobacteriales bacterium]|nr:TetR/AcrR family transcriptional regulator [Flavobacteriales bacterium]
MEKQRIKIIQKAGELFLRCGVRSLTMDDVSRELAISKKTLYKHVSDKSDLVQQVMKFHLEEDQQCFQELQEGDLNAIDELFEVSRVVSEKLSSFHPSVLFDLQKYYPEAWELFQNHKTEFIYNCMARNMERGIQQGLYRDNLNIPVIAKIYIARMDIVFNVDIFPADQFRTHEVYVEMLRYHVRGIASEKGIKYLVKKLQNMQTNLL